MSRWKRLASERLIATTLVLFASSIGGVTGCELIAKVDRSQIDETGGGGNGGMGGSGGAGGAACTPVDDMNDCTTDECVDGKPVNTPLTEGTKCGMDMTMFCDANAACVECLVASDCPGTDDECQTRTCTMGACGFDYTLKDTALQVQTAGDCKLKVCDGMGTQIDNNDDMDVPDDSNACTDDVCTAGVPSNPPLAAGTQCGMDGMGHPLVCNDLIQCVGCNVAADCPGTDDECSQRTCTNNVCGVSFTAKDTPVTAQTNNNCLVHVCDGAGNFADIPDDTDLPLDDGNACTGETCSMGAPNHPDVTDGTMCSDGDACTLADTCQMGTCMAGMPKTCTASDQCHIAGTCDSMTGMCSDPPAMDGTVCNDANACTTNEFCTAGACGGGSNVTCNDNNECTADACDPMMGCVAPPVTDGTACNDNNACTGTPMGPDACANGTCVAGSAVTCNDNLDCTADACDSMMGCIAPPAMDGTMCTSNMVAGACTMGACVACGDGLINGMEACDDGNATPGDGCNACAVETGYACTGAPSVCAPICGDGLLRPGEQCDDNNTTSGDGCSSTCQLDISCAMGEIPVIVANTTATPIPDSLNGVISLMNVTQAGVVRKVIPTLYVTHANTGHLDIFLQSPFGQQRTLVNDQGSSANFLATTFSDAAATAITTGTAPYTGSFRSVETLSDATGFGSQTAAGNWILRLSDDTGTLTGTLNAWALALCIDPSVPSVCGNGYVEANEQCDDGNATSGDGCNNCQMEITCGANETLVVQRSAQSAVLIPDNNLTGVLSPITIGNSGNVAKAVVVVNAIGHAFDGDLDISLVSPTNTTIDLSSDNGGAGRHYISTMLDDGATTAINNVAAVPPYRGHFRPEAALSGVTGQSANGIWNLKVADDAASDVGVMTSWSLGLCVAPPPVCGNGTVELGEACDDMGTMAGDGCSATCTIEQGWGCTGTAPSTCTFTCGNGTVTGNEQCDDGNTNNNDGCNNVCLWELTAETEDNGACATANGPYLPPFVIDGAITPIGDQDYVAVNVPAYADLKIQTFAPTMGVCTAGNDTVIELRASDCTTVITSNDEGGIPSCSLIDSTTTAAARHLAPGTYYINTRDYLNDGTIGAYKLQVRFNALCGNAIIEGSEQCDGGAGCDADCTLTPVCGNGVVQSGEQCDDGNTMAGDSCDATCQWETNAEVEPNGTTAEADTNATNVPQLLLDTTRNVTGGLTAADKDIFKVSVTAPDTVVRFETFDTSGRDCVGMTSTRLTLLDSVGVQLKQDAANSGIGICSELAVLLQPGTYYIQVDNSTGATVTNYFLRTVFHTNNGNEVEPNDAQATATANPGFVSQIFGDHQVSTDTDWYSVTVPTGASLRIETIEGDASETCESNGIDSTIALFNAAGVQLVTDGDGGRGYCSQIDGTGATPVNAAAKGLAAGTYFIRVTSFSTSATAGNQFNYRLVTVVR